MPTPLVKKYAEKYHTSVDEIESIWNKSKHIAVNKFKLKSVDDIKDSRIWAYITKTFIRIVKNKYENKTSVSTESIR